MVPLAVVDIGSTVDVATAALPCDGVAVTLPVEAPVIPLTAAHSNLPAGGEGRDLAPPLHGDGLDRSAIGPAVDIGTEGGLRVTCSHARAKVTTTTEKAGAIRAGMARCKGEVVVDRVCVAREGARAVTKIIVEIIIDRQAFGYIGGEKGGAKQVKGHSD